MILDDFSWRYATKTFDPKKKLSKEQLQQIIESLRLAPSSFGLQPWKFIFVEDQDLRQKLYPASWGNKQVLDCSHLLVMCAPLEMGDGQVDKLMKIAESASNTESLTKYASIMKDFLKDLPPPAKQQWMSDQVFIALGFLLAAAASLKIDACPMGGFLSKEYDEILQLKQKGLRSVVLCALGFRDQSDKYAQAPKTRFNQTDIVEFI